jgi:hypothetical protein
MESHFADLSQLVSRLWRSIERGEYDAAARLLSKDCRWERGGSMRHGREAIRASFDERATGLVARHQVSNLTLEHDEGEVICSYLLTVYSGQTASESAQPLQLAGPRLVADCFNRCHREGDAWVIREVGARIVFQASG